MVLPAVLVLVGGVAVLAPTWLSGTWSSVVPSAHTQVPTETRDVTAAVVASFPPFYRLDEHGVPAGFAIESFNEIARLAGLSVTYDVHDTWQGAIAAVRSGKAQLIPSIGISPQRRKNYLFSASVMAFPISVFVRAANVDVRGVGDLSGRRVGVVKENVAVNILSRYAEVDMVIFDTFPAALFDLLAGTIDAVVFPEPVGWRFADEAGLKDKIKIAGGPLREIKRAVALGQGQEDLLAVLNPAIKRYIQSPRYMEIYVSSFGTPNPFWNQRRTLILIVVIGVLWALSLGGWRHFSLIRLNRTLRHAEDKLEARVAERTQALEVAIEKHKAVQSDLADKVRELEFQKYAIDEHAIVGITDVKGNIIYANNKFCEISGYRRDELMGQNHRILRSGEHSMQFFADMWRTVASGNVWHGIVKNKNKNQGDYWVRTTIVPNLNERGKPFQYVAIHTDITERKEIEFILSKREARYHQLASVSSDWVWEMDENLAFSYISEEVKRIFGVGPEFFLGKTSNQLATMEDLAQEHWKEHLATLDDHRDFRDFRFRFLTEDRGALFLRVSGSPVLDDQGQFCGYRGTGTDVTVQVQAQHALAAAKKEADQANQAKSDFLSSMSHELRTPMNAILGFGQMLEFNPEQPLTTDQKECVDHIMTGGKHLLDLINDILDLSQIEAGKIALNIEDVSVAEIIEDCFHLTEAMAEARGISLSLPADADEIGIVRADYTRFKQVLLNLMSNAIKYNRENGTVSISLEKLPSQMVRISVTDMGDGIAKSKQGKLFKTFSRLGAENTLIEGTGIGLVVCKELVELMHGTINFESEEGKGSTFWIDLPLSTGAQGRVVKDLLATGGGAMQQAWHLQKINGIMLYVEDNASNLQLMEMIVSHVDGLTMYSAQTAEQGIDIARRKQPDVIVLDINLPGMSGLEAIRVLKNDDATRTIPVLALSAAATHHNIEAGLKAGFECYLTKPIDVVKITDAIRNALDSAPQDG